MRPAANFADFAERLSRRHVTMVAAKHMCGRCSAFVWPIRAVHPWAGKILVGFYQLITKVDDVYRITLPADVRQLTSIFSMGVSFGLGNTDSVDLRLLLTACAAPLVALNKTAIQLFF